MSPIISIECVIGRDFLLASINLRIDHNKTNLFQCSLDYCFNTDLKKTVNLSFNQTTDKFHLGLSPLLQKKLLDYHPHFFLKFIYTVL